MSVDASERNHTDLAFEDPTVIRAVLESEDAIPVIWASQFFKIMFKGSARFIAIGANPPKWHVHWLCSPRRSWQIEKDSTIQREMDGMVKNVARHVDAIKSASPSIRVDVLMDALESHRSMATMSICKRMMLEWHRTRHDIC